MDTITHQEKETARKVLRALINEKTEAMPTALRRPNVFDVSHARDAPAAFVKELLDWTIRDRERKDMQYAISTLRGACNFLED